MAAVPLLICDDSGMARKQLLRALPQDWAVSVTQATNGQEGLEAIRRAQGQVVLLDLTMPVMDGYQLLEAVRAEGHRSRIIVVSGDVQDEAVRRVMELGALAFLKKPVAPDDLLATLKRLDLLDPPGTAPAAAPLRPQEASISFTEAMREIVNVAMGRAAALMARVLDVFVELPVPNVNTLTVGELQMALVDAHANPQLTAVCQGFIGSGIAGEALLIFHDCDAADLSRLMLRDLALEYSDSEMLLDLSSLLVGACLSGIAEQVDVQFAQNHPHRLGSQGPIDELVRRNQPRWKPTLAVEISYALEGHGIHFDLLLLFTEDSVQLLRNKLAYVMN
ncbi:response regulator [Pseudomonas sp. HR96]|uniref:response regulator n=1 Tax=Pseudomonas sp. HR96 TaxID=1027966 RepID=UPI002A75AF7D|nr:response regulator [Pseudomonas sp. HR96]WPP00549.1 response regulator [Pseudomonas sp. HR96]